MQKRELFLLFFILGMNFYRECWSKPWPKGPMQCFGHECPESTVGCRRHCYMSKDKTSIISDITCLNSEGEAVSHFNENREVDESFSGVQYYEGFSYQGVFVFGQPSIDDDSNPSIGDDSNSSISNGPSDLNATTFYDDTPKAQRMHQA